MEFSRVDTDAPKAWAYISVWATFVYFRWVTGFTLWIQSWGVRTQCVLASWGMEKCIKPVRRQASGFLGGSY